MRWNAFVCEMCVLFGWNYSNGFESVISVKLGTRIWGAVVCGGLDRLSCNVELLKSTQIHITYESNMRFIFQTDTFDITSHHVYTVVFIVGPRWDPTSWRTCASSRAFSPSLCACPPARLWPPSCAPACCSAIRRVVVSSP